MAGPELHARLSPSSSSRWLACPYSLRAPSLPPGEAAREGTTAHRWAADVLLGNCMLTDVPHEFQDGVGLYANHVWENQEIPAVERYWESLDIDNFAGTIDCLLYRDRVCVVYDFKYGKWPVDAVGNTQLLCYSVLAAEHFDIGQFFGVIVQPNVYKGDKIKVAQYSVQQVSTHGKQVSLASRSEAKHTGDHCRFCPLRTLGECAEGVKHGKVKGWKS